MSVWNVPKFRGLALSETTTDGGLPGFVGLAITGLTPDRGLEDNQLGNRERRSGSAS